MCVTTLLLEHILLAASTVRNEQLRKFWYCKTKQRQKPSTSIRIQTQLKQTIVVTSRAATSFMSNRKSALVASVNSMGGGLGRDSSSNNVPSLQVQCVSIVHTRRIPSQQQIQGSPISQHYNNTTQCVQ